MVDLRDLARHERLILQRSCDFRVTITGIYFLRRLALAGIVQTCFNWGRLQTVYAVPDYSYAIADQQVAATALSQGGRATQEQ